MPADAGKLDGCRLRVLRIIPNPGRRGTWEVPITAEINVRGAEELPTAPRLSPVFSRSVSGAPFPLRQKRNYHINFGRQGEEEERY
ncbi:hypothetical protein C2857_000835 [Epichloe festucae Fl1]|uniref:Uncharacterized protein n=1 Tax=Epichloe festucae (strain Fl1) TaxID=877507 RepID=A0A7S9KU27_EPIFF|nr:hypothetical protein C2857_000835 [Epichloe festucae Fl1]